MGSNLISARKNIVYKHTGGDVVKKKNIIIIALSFLVVLILALLLGYGKKKEKDEKKQTLSQIKTIQTMITLKLRRKMSILSVTSQTSLQK